jgi:hypothetical protein
MACERGSMAGSIEGAGNTAVHVFASMVSISTGTAMSPEKLAMFGLIDADEYMRLSAKKEDE